MAFFQHHRLLLPFCIHPTVKKLLQALIVPVVQEAMNNSVPEITPLNCRKTEDIAVRINLLIPSINQEHVFGGISTALSFHEHLVKVAGTRKRLIVTDAQPNSAAIKSFSHWQVVHCHDESQALAEIVAFGDRHGKTIPVGINDIFIATSWWTAFHAQKILDWQRRNYQSLVRPLIYFIQDFEPGFYAWSSKYALAESTYHGDNPTIAVFNSSLLHNYFTHSGYSFHQEWMFEPVMNNYLRAQLDHSGFNAKKKQILIYGRPSVERNAFPLIHEALKAWVWQQPNVHEWELLSAGEVHRDLSLGNNMHLRALGKLSLDDYIAILRDSAIGISLMISPHPSYPPLEMAMFGLGVITNTFRNKDLSSWHQNIRSIQPTVNDLIIALRDRCCEFSERPQQSFPGHLLKKEYLQDREQFSFIDQIVTSLKLDA